MSAKNYSPTRGFAAVNKDGKKVYFSPSNAAAISDLPQKTLDSLLESGAIVELEADTKSVAVKGKSESRKTGGEA